MSELAVMPSDAAFVEWTDSLGIGRDALTPDQAARRLSVSRDFFDEHVKPELAIIRRGRLVLVPTRELDRWTDENASRVSRSRS